MHEITELAMKNINAGKAQQGGGEYRAKRLAGRCSKNAACGRQCALSNRQHQHHICQKPECHICHPPHDVAERWTPAEACVRARVDSMDVATWVLALGGLAGLWMGGLI